MKLLLTAALFMIFSSATSLLAQNTGPCGNDPCCTDPPGDGCDVYGDPYGCGNCPMIGDYGPGCLSQFGPEGVGFSPAERIEDPDPVEIPADRATKPRVYEDPRNIRSTIFENKWVNLPPDKLRLLR
jgi:hypothetical protein